MQFRGGQSELMRQAARMQRKIEQIKEELKTREVTATAAGDKVKATATCEGKVSRIEVDPAFLASEGLEMTCDAIAAAVNSAVTNATKLMDDEVAKIMGGAK
ncbi:MAG: YbaB/EbfC family nucleoid-associated protein [Polyangiaceae bacterium]